MSGHIHGMVEKEDPNIKNQRKRLPDGGPERCLPQGDLVCVAVEHAKIQREHRNYNDAENQPQPEH